MSTNYNGALTLFSAYVVVLDVLLLLLNHVLEVHDGPGLELQVQKQLHVLALQEVVLNHQFQVVLNVSIFDSG